MARARGAGVPEAIDGAVEGQNSPRGRKVCGMTFLQPM